MRQTRWACAAFMVGVSGCADSPAGDTPEVGSAGAANAASDTGGSAADDVADLDTTADAAVAEDTYVDTTDDVGPATDTGLVPGDYCAVWDTSLAGPNVASLRRFAVTHAQAVVSGSLGDKVLVQGSAYAPLTVTEVHFGWSFLVGVTALVPIPDDLDPAAALAWTAAISQSHPNPWDSATTPYWGNTTAVFPRTDLDGLGAPGAYRLPVGAQVAIVRITAQDAQRTTFTVTKTLAGTLPASFQDNWYAEWTLPYPAPGEQEYVATLMGVSEIPADGTMLGSVLDFRPATAEALASVKAAIASDRGTRAEDDLRAFRDDWLLGFRFHTSPIVLSSVVTGRAGECCSNAGGNYVAHETKEVLKGAGDERFVIGGHGYYGAETCGDTFFMGLSSVVPLAGLIDPPWDCSDNGATNTWDWMGPHIESPVRVMTAGGGDARKKVTGWLTASHPLLALHAPDVTPSDLDLAQDPNNAPWSAPLDAADAFSIATTIALITVDAVSVDADTGAHVVTLTTTFSPYEYEHLTKHQVKVVFTCGDARLLEIGRRWLAPLVMLDLPQFSTDAPPPDLSRAFLIPGVLLPESALSDQLQSDLQYRLPLALEAQEP